MNKIKNILAQLRLLLILPGIDWQDDKFRKDLARWRKICRAPEQNVAALALLLWDKKEFRNLLIYRNSHRPLYRRWIGLVYKPMDTLYLETPEIGGGLFIHHGFATMVAARSIGENCWINQQVTIGYGKGTEPPCDR